MQAGKEKAVNIKQAKMVPATTWRDLEDIMLGEISQRQILHDLLHIESKNTQIEE